MPEPDSKNKRRLIHEQNQAVVRYFWLITQLGVIMAGSILLCLGSGIALYYWLHFSQSWLILFILAGVIAGFFGVYRLLKHEFRN